MDAIALAIPVFFLLMGLELAWSAWSGRKVYRFNDFVANLGCGIGSQVVGAFSKTLVFVVYMWIYDHARLFTLPNTVVTWVVTFLLIDLLYYWFHRLSHEVNFLWAAHIVHHQSEEYNLSVALRQSWWQGLFSFWFYVPVALLGVHPIIIVTVGAFVTLYQFWIHTRAIGNMGIFEHILNTPSNHRVHHGSDPKYIDRNHGGTLIIWDKLFGTFQNEEEEPVYGITSPLGTWDPLKANFHYWSELIDQAKRCSSWKDKVLTFLKPPGWRPAELGGLQHPKPIEPTRYRKFDIRIPSPVNGYVITQFTLLLGITTFFLFQRSTLSPWVDAATAGLIILWLTNLGLLLDGRRWAIASEGIRILVFCALLILGAGIQPNLGWSAAVFSLLLLSAVHLLVIERGLTSTKVEVIKGSR